MRQQNKLSGHVIRADGQEPMRLPTIDSKFNTPGVVIRRRGKPRLHWVKENGKWVCKDGFEKQWDHDNEDECIRTIIDGSMARQF